jgi:GntR family transcriptional regulator/MocR family aminotransferase
MELHVSLVGRTNLTREIYRQLMLGIRAGRLQPGERLPPTRELAKQLNVSRMTVVVAYDQLTGEGYLTSRVGDGTFVSQHAASVLAPARLKENSLRPRSIWGDVPIAVVRGLYENRAEFDFRTGLPDATLFPYDSWRRLIARESMASAEAVGVYGDPAGHRGLRAAIARHIGVSRGVNTLAAHVTVTSGTQQALDIIGKVLLAPGDRAAVEDPGYPPAWRLFKALGARVTAVPVDSEGLVVDALPDNTRLVYVSPSHQFPLGVSMSLGRRTALLSWAQRHNAAIIEDDYDSEFRFGGRPIEPLQTMDMGGRVIYVGSFSKTMLPTLRLGFVVTPPSLSEAMSAAKYVTDWNTPLAAQAAMAHFIDQGLFARHLRKMRGVYRARHTKVVGTLAREFADHLEVIPSAAGLHVCAVARGGSVDALHAVAVRASAVGVDVHELARYAVAGRRRAGLLLGYGAIATERIDDGLRRLRQCFD